MMSTPALAGSLSEGLFGYKWGPLIEFPKPTEGVCSSTTMSGIPWVCERMIGETKVLAFFHWKQQTLFGVAIQATGFENCSSLWTTLTVAWGKPKGKYSDNPGVLEDSSWYVPGAGGTWTYNKYDSKCTAQILHIPSYERVTALERDKAAAGVKDL